MTSAFPELNPTPRILLGPGPSNVNPRVMKATVSPMVGHLDPDFVAIMEEIKKLLRMVFRTENEITFPVSGTGSAAMELVMANLIEPGDEVVIGVAGAFGERLADLSERLGAQVTRVQVPWGRAIAAEDIDRALAALTRPKLVAIVHAETSTGVHQPIEEVAQSAHRYGALVVVDAVTSLACVPLEIDRWQIDACYSCTQKGLSAPPGLGPVTFSPKAIEAVRQRTTKCRSWYFDLALVQRYWGADRVYHHTAPITMNYALYEALRIIVEEGMEPRWRRHELNAAALVAGLEAMGLSLTAEAGRRLPQLTAVGVPAGVNEAAVRTELLKNYNIEIGAGLGPFAGKIWRIGLMGESCRRENVVAVLSALEQILDATGYEVARGTALAAADRVYA